MATGAKPVIYTERKRLTFVTTMAFLAGVVFYLRADVYVGGIHLSLITGLIYAWIIGSCALVICIALPSMRFMIEAVAVSRLILSFFVFIVPSIGYTILANPTITALVTVGGGMMVSRVIHGRIHKDASPKSSRGMWSGLMSQRLPVVVSANPRQQRFVNWMEDAEPVRLSAHA